MQNAMAEGFRVDLFGKGYGYGDECGWREWVTKST